MIRTRTRKIIRDIWARKLRTALVSMSIFIGVLGVVTLISAGDLLITKLEQDIQEDELAMTRSTVQLPNLALAQSVDNAAVLERIAQLEGVTVVEGRAVNEVNYRKAGAEDFETGVLATNFEPFSESQLEPVRLVEGRFPQNTPDTERIEIAIDRRFAEAQDLAIGDVLELRLLRSTEQPLGDAVEVPTTRDVPVVEAEIVGIAFQAYGYPADLGSGDRLMFATFDDSAYVLNSRALTLIYARYETFEQAEAGLADFRAAIAETPYFDLFTQAENPAENAQIEQTRGTNNALVALAMIALVVSGFLVVNVLTAIVSEQRRQIGAMKAIGANGLDNFYIYAGIAVAYGVIGVVPGVLLGIPAGYAAAQQLAAQNNTFIDEFSLSWQAVVAGAIIGLLV
ncbi:MAG: ABC transporter permease, partial [Chloroflexi bacterium]